MVSLSGTFSNYRTVTLSLPIQLIVILKLFSAIVIRALLIFLLFLSLYFYILFLCFILVINSFVQSFLLLFFRYCGVSRPSWMELRNFVYFFNQQLIDSEASIFTNPAMNEDLRGFKGFVIRFLLEMAKASDNFHFTDNICFPVAHFQFVVISYWVFF